MNVAHSEIPEEAQAFYWKGGPTGCLMLHGFTGTPWPLRDLGKALHEQGFTVSAPLLPGHGTSPSDLARTRWHQWLECSEESLISLQKRCHSLFVLGFSAGGSLALALAARHPIEGCILLSTPLRLKMRQRVGLPVARLLHKTDRKKKKNAIHGFLTWDMSYDRYPLASVSELSKMLKQVRNLLPRVSCPALILHARRDRKVPVHNAYNVYRRIPGHDKIKVILDDPCHMITKGEEKKRVEEEIVRFLRTYENNRGGGKG